jgi:glycosyltransferase involved in cell wall biosynthesis
MARTEPIPPPGTDLRVGVNVAGYFDSALGVGEAARQLSTALRQAGVAVEELTLPERRARSASAPPPPRAPHPTTLLCVNADAVEGARDWLGTGFHATRTIGYWWWELEQFPERWRRSFDGLDEVWVGTRFVADAIGPASPVPVLTMPLPVVAHRAAALDRAELGVPEGFLFLFTFDFASGFARKNPLGAVQAFTRAFAPGSGAALVVKHVGSEPFPEALAQLEAAAARHPDVHLVGGYLDPERQAALTAACDCYVSLHRSEGFGLTLAEAVLAGKPVVATGYSGPLDFLGPSSAFLVDHELVPVGPGNEPYPPEARWAEPDLDHAAALMEQVRSDPAAAATRVEHAARAIAERHDPAVAGAAMASRIARLQGLSKPETAAEANGLGLEELDRRIQQWPPPAAGGTGRLRRLVRDAALRLGRPQAVHERRVHEETLRVLRTLEEEVHGLAAVQQSLAARLEALERRHGDGPPPRL